MNALFVDDEMDVLDGILNEIEFDAIGIDNVYTANTAMKAKIILSDTPIDLLVTDIEMPEMSGLQLLEWAQENKLSMVSIFCTAYSDFNYTRKAIQLRAFDYFLKPIFYEDLQEKLSAAVTEAKRLHCQELMKQKSHYWEGIQAKIKNSFWENLVERPSHPNRESIERLKEEYKQAYAETEVFHLAAINIAEGDATRISSLCEEVLRKCSVGYEALYCPASSVINMIFRGRTVNSDRVPQLCKKMLDGIHSVFGCSLSMFYLSNVPCEQVHQAFQRIRDAMGYELATQNRCYDVATHIRENVHYHNENLARWEKMLCLNQTEQVMHEAEAFLDGLASLQQLTRQTLVAFRIDLMQLVYAVLRCNDIVPHEMFQDTDYEQRYVDSIQSVGKMKKYVRYLLTMVRQKIDELRESDTVIGKAVQYIRNHLNERITRETLAAVVYLNPDYFARIFRQNLQMSIGSYLKKCRMEEAQRLLANSSHTIGMIAYEVGFDNFSYFSQIFRKTTGCSPKEYRMQYRKDSNLPVADRYE